MKRVDLSIVSKKHPEEILSGYALITELNEQMLSFFSTKKFLIDEGLTITMNVAEDVLEFQLTMSHLHEQISSGKIMNALPSEEHPFPARKFYRCFAKVLEYKRNGVVMTEKPTLTAVPPLEVVTTAPEVVPAAAIPAETPPAAEVAVPESELKAA